MFEDEELYKKIILLGQSVPERVEEFLRIATAISLGNPIYLIKLGIVGRNVAITLSDEGYRITSELEISEGSLGRLEMVMSKYPTAILLDYLRLINKNQFTSTERGRIYFNPEIGKNILRRMSY